METKFLKSQSKYSLFAAYYWVVHCCSCWNVALWVAHILNAFAQGLLMKLLEGLVCHHHWLIVPQMQEHFLTQLITRSV